jgi:hypothetical protein
VGTFILADITGGATLALAIVTAVLALVTTVGVWVTLEALGVANRDSQEAIKSRIDQRSPLVVVVPEDHGHNTAFWDSETPNAVVLEVGTVPDRNKEIGITGWFRIQNEGHSTALVHLHDGMVMMIGANVTYHIGGLGPRPRARSEGLAPGEAAMLVVHVARLPQEWGDLAVAAGSPEEPAPVQSLVPLVITDTFEQGTKDTITIELSGMPLHRMSERAEWVGAGSETTTLRVHPTRREYPGLPSIRSSEEALLRLLPWHRQAP